MIIFLKEVKNMKKNLLCSIMIMMLAFSLNTLAQEEDSECSDTNSIEMDQTDRFEFDGETYVIKYLEYLASGRAGVSFNCEEEVIDVGESERMDRVEMFVESADDSELVFCLDGEKADVIDSDVDLDDYCDGDELVNKCTDTNSITINSENLFDFNGMTHLIYYTSYTGSGVGVNIDGVMAFIDIGESERIGDLTITAESADSNQLQFCLNGQKAEEIERGVNQIILNNKCEPEYGENAFNAHDCYCGPDGYQEESGKSFKTTFLAAKVGDSVNIKPALMSSVNSYDISWLDRTSDNSVQFKVNGETTGYIGIGKSEVVGGLNITVTGSDNIAMGICAYETEETKLEAELDRLSEICTGCIHEENCIPSGTRSIIDDVPKYCDINKEFKEFKLDGDACLNNYECDSNSCLGNVCKAIEEEIQQTQEQLEQTQQVVQTTQEELATTQQEVEAVEADLEETKSLLGKIADFLKSFFKFGE